MALIAGWHFNEASGAASDVSGNSLTANLGVGGTRVSGQSGYGNALSLNGTSDYLQIAANSAIGNLTASFTISAWIFVDSLADIRTIFWHAESPSSSVGFYFYVLTSGALGFTTANVFDYTSVTAIVATGVWTHVAAVFDSAFDVTFFLDAVQKDTIAGTAASPANTTQVMFIGAAPTSSTTPDRFWFDGLIDDLRIHDIAQSQAQINTDMNTPLIPSVVPETRTIVMTRMG